MKSEYRSAEKRLRSAVYRSKARYWQDLFEDFPVFTLATFHTQKDRRDGTHREFVSTTLKACINVRQTNTNTSVSDAKDTSGMFPSQPSRRWVDPESKTTNPDLAAISRIRFPLESG